MLVSVYIDHESFYIIFSTYPPTLYCRISTQNTEKSISTQTCRNPGKQLRTYSSAMLKEKI